ncbi:MAG: Signal peptide peptidase SppA (protease 4) [Candidatus Kapaibacterium sp.]|nr:MAG: Signal peptide peptidase SppA (protease 4) [Candidatus Kapabacteria bacterium]
MPEQFKTNVPIPPQYEPTRKRSRWWVPIVIIGVVVLFFLVVFIMIFSSISNLFEREPVVVKTNSVLVINLNRPIAEYVGESLSSLFSQDGTIAYYDLLKAIENASTDNKIKGIYLRCSASMIGWAKRVELVEALERFKKSGKFIYAFIEVGNENDYYLALPSDKIFLAREGVVEMNGFSISALFLKGLFDKIGIEYYVQQFEDYKSAGETYSRTKFSDSARVAYKDLLLQRYELFLAGVEKYRKIKRELIVDVLNRGVYSPDSLLALGFVDSLINDNQAKDYIRGIVSGEKDKVDTSKSKVNFVDVSDYIKSEDFGANENRDKEKAIAIVYASGPIVQRIQKSPLSTDVEIDPDSFIKNLKKARDDKKVKAIIIRIDSPGGSVIASDEIWNEIEKTKKIKPVYASMSDVAASGGYYIAMACDTIIAHPATITGSIGVISIVPNFSSMMNKIGVTVDTISTNNASQDLNLFIPFSKRQKEKLEELSRPIYFRFLEKVAKSRKKTLEEVRSVAKGRVWTGEKALEKGLVDVLGGLQDAITIASKRIGVVNPTIKRYPRPMEDFEILLNLFSKKKDEAKGIQETGILNILSLFPQELKMQVLQYLQFYYLSHKEQNLVILPYLIWIN